LAFVATLKLRILRLGFKAFGGQTGDACQWPFQWHAR
jgi:hypothetical protein